MIILLVEACLPIALTLSLTLYCSFRQYYDVIRQSIQLRRKKGHPLKGERLTMALVAGYESDEDDDISELSVPAPSTSRAGPTKAVHAAPEVSLEVPLISLFNLTIQDPMQLKQMLLKPSDKQLSYNIS